MILCKVKLSLGEGGRLMWKSAQGIRLNPVEWIVPSTDQRREQWCHMICKYPHPKKKGTSPQRQHHLDKDPLATRGWLRLKCYYLLLLLLVPPWKLQSPHRCEWIPQRILPKGSGLKNIYKNISVALFCLLTLMVLTEMGSGVATSRVTPHERTPTSSVRVEERNIWKHVTSAPNWLLPCLSE